MADSEGHKSKNTENLAVLSTAMTSGPKGLGDPDDRSMRHLEKTVLVEELMRQNSRKLCHAEAKAFEECLTAAGSFFPFKCRKEVRHLKECQHKWWLNEDFRKQCEEEYLETRAEYRRTGITKRETLSEHKLQQEFEEWRKKKESKT